MSTTVSQMIIAAPINRSNELDTSPDDLLGYMARQFPGIEFVLDVESPIRQPDRFALIPIMGTAGSHNKPGRMLTPLPPATMAEMYEALERYGPSPSVN